MRKIVDDARLIYKCCKLYYEDRLSQQQIADRLLVSRVSVSRMLGMGREMGMVEVKVIAPIFLSYTETEQRLEQYYGLKEAVVVENSPLSTRFDHTTALGKATIRLLQTYLHDNDVVGVSMGRTLRNICQSAEGALDPIRCTFVPALGGVDSGRRSTQDIHANQIAREFANIFGGDCIQFYAPAMFSDQEILLGFLKEQMMQDILRRYEEMKTILVGVGVPDHTCSSVVKAGYLTEHEMNWLVKQHIVGDICLQFYDRNGKTAPYESYNHRVAGMPLERIRQVENRIAVASGKKKAESVFGAMRGEFINILVTDEACALELIRLAEEKKDE